MSKMNKFQQLLADNTSSTLQRRAGVISDTAKIAQQNLVNSLKQEKSRLELKLTDLTDFAPDSTESLRPGTSDWDPVTWVSKLQETKEELYQVTISLKLAEETFNEYFSIKED